MEKEKKKSGGKPKDVFAFLGKHSKLAESPFFFFFLPFQSKDLLHDWLREGSKGGGGGGWGLGCADKTPVKTASSELHRASQATGEWSGGHLKSGCFQIWHGF